MVSPAFPVRQQQQEWALRKGISFDKAGYTLVLRDNLFQPLSPCAEEEFRAGDGAELGKLGTRGKMQALHSSSALACNVFDYWRGRDTSALAKALDVSGPICSVAFEQKFPTGLRGKAPNLDVVLRPREGPRLAIESKFLEPYAGTSAKSGFKAKYFETEPGLWHKAGYSGCQALARSLYEGDHANSWLNAEQLLKHILGLSRSGKEWTLLYLWYEVTGSTIAEHAKDIGGFAQCVTGDGIAFKAMSYQELLRRLQGFTDARDAAYIGYLKERYFPDVAV